MKGVVSRMKEFKIYIENRTGALADLCELLANNAVNIKGISTNGDGVRIVTSDEKTTRDILSKARHSFDEDEVLIMSLADRPGEMAKISRMLSRAGVNIEAAYIIGGNSESKDVVLKVSDNGKAIGTLRF